MRIRVSEVRCPECGAEEMHPTENWRLIRAFKVYDKVGAWSQCLVCAGYYNDRLEITEENYDRGKGWFCN